MDEYFIGVVQEYQLGKIIFEYSNRGFILQGVDLHLLPLNQTLKLYVYFYQRLPISEYFAFLNQETKQYFLELISINYVGPKLALRILNFFSLEELKNIIVNYHVVMLQKIKGITNKLSLSIINHFQYKNDLYTKNSQIQTKWMFVFDALLKLGFNKNVVNKYLSSISTINWTDSLQVIINQAIKEITKQYYL